MNIFQISILVMVRMLIHQYSSATLLQRLSLSLYWLVWNIRPDTQEIPENSVPKDAFEGITSWGKPGYNGPCPPTGVHRYFFKIFALDTVLDDLHPLSVVD